MVWRDVVCCCRLVMCRVADVRGGSEKALHVVSSVAARHIVDSIAFILE